MDSRLISVIVPVYNVEKYLDKCVQSIIGQTYKNLQIILVDDGSPDNCPEMCDNYAALDSRIKVIHKKNGGLSDARNAGIEKADGEYFAFIDSDDYISHQFIEILYNAAVSQKAQIVQTNLLRFKDEDIVDDSDKAVNEIRSYTGAQMNYNLYSDLYVPTVVVWSKLYEARLFDDIRFPVGKINEDEFTTYRLLYKCDRVCFIDQPLYYYRFNETSIMNSSFSLKRMHKTEALEERMKFYKENNERELYLLTVKEYCRYIRMNYYKIKEFINPHDMILKDLRQKIRKVRKDYDSINDTDKHTRRFVFSPSMYEIIHLKALPYLKNVLKKQS